MSDACALVRVGGGAPMTRGRTVLVVDDEPDVRNTVAMILEDEGYRVVTARDGREALNKVRSQLPDAILLDLMMPVLDGAGFLRECRANPECRRVPVLVMS